MRFRKSIFDHHFRTVGKLAKNEFQYHTEVVYSIQWYNLTKNMFFPHVRKFVLNSGPFCLLDLWPFGPYFCPFFHANFVLFSNARSILQLMLWNSNLTILYILPPSSSNMKAPALLINEHLKKEHFMFLSSFYQVQRKGPFLLTFSTHLRNSITYVFTWAHSYCELLICSFMAAIIIGKDHVCKTSLVFVITNLTCFFFGFSLVQTKTKLESLNGQQ